MDWSPELKAAETAFPPAERGQHDAIEHVKDAVTGREVYRVSEPTQIERYFRQGALGRLDRPVEAEEAATLLAAGLEYERCAYVGCLGPRYAKINMHRVIAMPTDSEDQAKAAEKIRKADEALGNFLSGYVWAVCVEGYGAAAWGKARAQQLGYGDPGRKFGIEVLREALRQLVAHWAQ